MSIRGSKIPTGGLLKQWGPSPTGDPPVIHYPFIGGDLPGTFQTALTGSAGVEFLEAPGGLRLHGGSVSGDVATLRQDRTTIDPSTTGGRSPIWQVKFKTAPDNAAPRRTVVGCLRDPGIRGVFFRIELGVDAEFQAITRESLPSNESIFVTSKAVQDDTWYVARFEVTQSPQHQAIFQLAELGTIDDAPVFETLHTEASNLPTLPCDAFANSQQGTPGAGPDSEVTIYEALIWRL